MIIKDIKSGSNGTDRTKDDVSKGQDKRKT